MLTGDGGREGYQARQEFCRFWSEFVCHERLGKSGIWTSLNGELCPLPPSILETLRLTRYPIKVFFNYKKYHTCERTSLLKLLDASVFFSSSWADIENGAKLQTHIASQVSLSFLKLHWKSVEYANIKFYLGMFHILFFTKCLKNKGYALY